MAEQLTAFISSAESARFGRSTLRVNVPPSLSVGEAAVQLTDILASTEAEIVILRYPSEALGLFAGADLDGWARFPGGSLLYWRAPSHPVHDGSGTRELTGEERTRHAAEIDAMLRDSFAGYVNHYAANPLIEPDAAVLGYAQWAQAIASDARNRIFTVDDPEGIVGAAAISVSDGGWDINLAGVLSRAQRRGHYRRLLSGIVAAAESEKAELVISTQSHNIPVQRAWAAEGFLPDHSVDTVHLVPRAMLTRRG